MSNTVWCWRFIIREPLYDDQDDDFSGCTDYVPIDKYNPTFVDDMTAYYNWVYGEYRWYVIDTDLVEMEKRELTMPQWIGFVDLYGDGSCLDNWDWKSINFSN